MKPSATVLDWMLVPRSDLGIEDDWFVAGPYGDAVRNPGSPIPVDMLDLLLEHGYEPSLHRDGVAW